MKRTWSVVVVFEDAATRQQAVEVCDHLVKRFWTDFELAVSWWSCAMLEQPVLASDALQKAAEADLLIFALGTEEGLPMPVQEWIETWLSMRGERDGALVDLLVKEVEAGEAPASLFEGATRGPRDPLAWSPRAAQVLLRLSLEHRAGDGGRQRTVADING